MSELIYQSIHTGAEIDEAISKIPNLEQQINDLPKGKRVARFVIGTSTSGWTEKDCDYLCDGTNDQEEIIQALNDLPATGGEIVILDGTYNITAEIEVNKSNVSIKGNNTTILKRMWDSSSNEGVITLSYVSGCRIGNLQISGDNSVYTSSKNYGIYLHYAENNIVTGCCCNNHGSGIYSWYSDRNAIIGNICNDNKYGIYIGVSHYNTITGNIVNNGGSMSSGIYIISADYSNITGNTCSNCSYGIHLQTSGNSNVVGNNCSMNSGNGIYLSSTSNNNTITGNACNNNSNGIRLSSSSNNTVTGNTCIRGIGTPEDYTTSQYTIFLSGTGNDYNLISSNNCMGKAPVVEGGTGNTLVNNKWDAA